jgi:hypothetical protein
LTKKSKQFAEELLNGLRKDGRSVVECCLQWGITDTEYEELLQNDKKLQHAHQIGEMQAASWWHFTYRELAAKGNASVLQMGMKNVEKVGWQDRPDGKKEAPEPIKAITITVLPPREE